LFLLPREPEPLTAAFVFYAQATGLLTISSDGKEIPTASGDFEGTYAQLAAQYPKSSACKHIPLKFLPIDRFRARLNEALRPLLRKGVPSLFNSMRHFYSDAAKV